MLCPRGNQLDEREVEHWLVWLEDSLGGDRRSLEELAATHVEFGAALARNPGLEVELQGRLERLRAVDRLLDCDQAGGVNSPQVPGFEIFGILGHGGVGVVYRARQQSLGREVAIKVILGGRFASPRTRQRFRFEAETAARLHHPNIVQVYDHGELDGLPYIAQELARIIHQGVGRVLGWSGLGC